MYIKFIPPTEFFDVDSFIVFMLCYCLDLECALKAHVLKAFGSHPWCYFKVLDPLEGTA
jgi:hypothetical protein